MARIVRDMTCVVCGNAASPEYTVSDEANNDQPFCSTDCQAICDNRATIPPRNVRVKHARGIGNSLGNASATILSFPCTLEGCNERFSTPSNVLDHVKTHTEHDIASGGVSGMGSNAPGSAFARPDTAGVASANGGQGPGGTTAMSAESKLGAQDGMESSKDTRDTGNGTDMATAPGGLGEQYPEIHLLRIAQVSAVPAPHAPGRDHNQQPQQPQQQQQQQHAQALPQPGSHMDALSAPPAIPVGVMGHGILGGAVSDPAEGSMANGVPGVTTLQQMSNNTQQQTNGGQDPLAAKHKPHSRGSSDSQLDTAQAANSLATLNMSTAHLSNNNNNINSINMNNNNNNHNMNNNNTNPIIINTNGNGSNNNNTTTTMTLTHVNPDRQMTVFSEHSISYPCVFKGCTASFSRGTSLANHAKTHTAEHKFFCTRKECGKKFMSEGYLARHMRIHARKDLEAAGVAMPGTGTFGTAGDVLMIEGGSGVAAVAGTGGTGEGEVGGAGKPMGTTGTAQPVKRKAQDQGGTAKTVKADATGAVLEKVAGDGGQALASVGEPIGVGQSAVAGQTGGANTAVAGSGQLTGTMVVKDATDNPTAGVGGVLVQYQDPATLPRVHKCTFEGCAASFSRGTSLANHSKTHNKERPYECTECGQTFMGPGYLSRHLKIHRKKAERAATLQLNWQW